jgi:hypothetical protein
MSFRPEVIWGKACFIGKTKTAPHLFKDTGREPHISFLIRYLPDGARQTLLAWLWLLLQKVERARLLKKQPVGKILTRIRAREKEMADGVYGKGRPKNRRGNDDQQWTARQLSRTRKELSSHLKHNPQDVARVNQYFADMRHKPDIEATINSTFPLSHPYWEYALDGFAENAYSTKLLDLEARMYVHKRRRLAFEN